jgi:ABC-2 type transport system ATP-binding protein
MKEQPGDQAPAIETHELTKTFNSSGNFVMKLLRRGNSRVEAIKAVNLQVNSGEVFGLVGRNGAGKTTLIKSIATLIEPTAGWVRVFGFDSVKHSFEVKTRIGLVTSDDRSFYWRLTGWQNMMFFARLYGLDTQQAKARIGRLVELLGVEQVAKKRFNEFSTGNKQKLAIARALLNDPPLVLLDEPTRSLDPLAAADLRRMVRERMSRNKTVVITTHNLAEVEEMCGRIAIISKGEIKECATLEGLRTKYGLGETVTLTVRRLSTDNGLRELASRIPTLRYGRQDDQAWEIEFAREKDDELLNLAVSNLVAAGAEILSCRTTHVGLKEIMERIERGDDASAPESLAASEVTTS